MDEPLPDGTPANRALSAVEAASLLGVSQRTIRRAIASGALPAVKQDGVYRIERSTLDRYACDAPTKRLRPHLRTAGAIEPVGFDLGRPHTPLIGRNQELSELGAALSASHASLITLTGPGGVGKTRLALEAAGRVEHAFPDGVHVVGLAPVRDPELVAPAIAQSFGLDGGSSSDAVDRIVKTVRDRRILLVVDNLEQVTAAASSISRLFHRCPHLTVLSTSRAPLRISDEVEYAVSPLALADFHGTRSFDELIAVDAVQLFAARARAVKRDFSVTHENVEAVAAICKRLDGLPLAIELAAARVRVLPPAELLRRLDPRLPLLTGGPRDRPSHQQTMRDTIAWSHSLLSIEDQMLFQQLSVFVGGFSLAAAEAVAQMPTVFDGIARLIEQNLIQQSTDALGVTRFTMLETVREFGLDLLLATPDETSVRARHAAWMLGYAAHSSEAWSNTDYAVWSDRIEVERGNLRAALAWANDTDQTELAMQLAVASNRFWRVRGPVSEGVDWLERALARTGAVPPVLRVEALELSADLATVAGDLDLAVVRVTQGEALAREIGDPGRLDMVLSVRARILFLLGRAADAIPILEEGLALGPLHGWKANIASDMCNLGVAVRMAGDPARSVPLLEAGWAFATEIGLTYVESSVIMCMADAFRDLGDSTRAGALYRDGLRLAIEQHERRNAAIAISGLAALAAASGNGKDAARLCGSAAALLDQVGAAMTPGGQECYRKASELARAAIGDATFERAWSAGWDLSPDTVLAESSSQWPARRDGLTRRELEVLRLLVEGKSNQAIADDLYISSRTVTNHVASILSKLDVHSRSAAASYALRNDLI